MDVKDLKDYCGSKYKSYIDYPFGEVPICFKLNEKFFAQIYPYPNDYKITLKCEPMTGDFYRQIYPNIVVRGYHCPPVQQPFWNTIYIDRISKEELFNMIDHAYDYVLKSFSKKKQQEINVINSLQSDKAHKI